MNNILLAQTTITPSPSTASTNSSAGTIGSTKITLPDCPKDSSGHVQIQGNACLPGDTGATALTLISSNITTLFFIVIGIVAFISIVYSGIMMITSGGDTAKMETGKKNILWAIIGLVVISMSYWLVSLVYGLASQAVPK